MLYDALLQDLISVGIIVDNKLVPRYKHIIDRHNMLSTIINHTSFLLNDATLSERMFCIIHNITEIVKCECGNVIQFKYHKYNKFCSHKCANNNIEKIKISVSKVNQQVKVDKFKQTCLQKYNVPHTSQLISNRQLAAKTTKERYGINCVLSLNENQKLAHNAIKEKYGVNSVMELDYYKNKQRKHRYDKMFSDNIHLESALKLINNEDWLYQQHIARELPLQQIATNLHINDSTVGRYLRKADIQTKLFSSSVGEKEVYSFIQQLGVDVIRNDRKIISPKELDIYIPYHKIAIEYCGLYWHSEQQGKDKWYHYNKWKECNDKGIQLITIFEDEWIYRNEQVKSKLKSLLGVDDRPIVYARKTKIVSVDKKTKKDFFNANHLQGNGHSSINIGLTHNDDIVAVMALSRNKDSYNLDRYATSERIIGGFSKLLNYFCVNFDWNEIITFADLRWSNGHLYTQTNWNKHKTIPPDYSYVISGTNKRIHKFNYRRKYLPTKLKNFDHDLSERENCDNNGLLRIWDCGKIKYNLLNNK